jgi:NADH:ubiquinone oxidoreductase subunit F (NADH-binding)/(2Fe-2S) ferredoxin/NAD-dependent dihydropyrimidine dehydrogenase PreA subunit
MQRAQSIADFRTLVDLVGKDVDPVPPTIVVSAGTCGQASGANTLIRAIKREILTRDLAERVRLRVTGCQGFCQMEPSLLIDPQRTFYPRVAPKSVPAIIDSLLTDRSVDELLYVEPRSDQRIASQDDIPFFKKQVRLLLGRNESLDPIRIYNYLEVGGYGPLCKVLELGDPDWVLAQVTDSQLRGRGGAGFSTGRKWEMLARQTSRDGKTLVCNADEGDPGAYMDRSILEGNPHGIIEGMLIGAYATGATEGVLYVRNEYPLAIKHLVIALRQARELGLLGDNILGTGFSFDLRIVRGAGAFVCGEETALIRSIEGKMGEPRQRPPYPVQCGINGHPTAINNVETWANIPIVIEQGAAAYARIGTPQNSGTKIFSLVGKIQNTGLIEVPMGITIREIVHDIGGGPIGDATIKAVQTGGPSGGCIPASSFDLPVDYDSLSEVGSIMGSGGMIAMDNKTCMVDVAKYFMGFLKDESCGKCYTCRKGTQRMHEILDDISNGTATPDHIGLLQELAIAVHDTTMCGLGQTAPNPVLSTIRHFMDEYSAHVADHRCPAGVCRELITYFIKDNCTGCGVCVKACPEDAISGEKKQRHVIDVSKCVKCGACQSACKFEAIETR